MIEREIPAPSMQPMEAAQRVEEILRDVMPDEEIFRTRSGDRVTVGVKMTRQRVRIYPMEGGGSTVSAEMDNDTALSRIQSAFGGSSYDDRSHEQPTLDDSTPDKTPLSGVSGEKSQTPKVERTVQERRDGFGQVHKPFDHTEASYRSPGDMDFNDNHPRCRDCAHYDNHGNCRIVPDIDPDGYCGEFYADAGFFGHSHGKDGMELNLKFWGDGFDWDNNDVKGFIDKVRTVLKDKIDGAR